MHIQVRKERRKETIGFMRIYLTYLARYLEKVCGQGGREEALGSEDVGLVVLRHTFDIHLLDNSNDKSP